jgi:hypothetical protein
MLERYSHYKTLTFAEHPNGVLEVIMGAPGRLATADHTGHFELARVWRDIGDDRDVRAAVLRGEGKGFSAGGDFSLVEDMATDFEVRARVWREARDLVYNVINCDKPIVSAMHGPAVGAGLVAGLLADIPIAARDARIVDGHTRLGVAAGDHAAIIWPLLCGMAKAKYYLMLCEPVSGEEARADRSRRALRRGRGPAQDRARHRAAAGDRVTDRDPLDQVRAQQLAADDGSDVRHVARRRVPGLLRTGRPRRRGEPSRAARAELPEGLAVLTR